MQNNRRVQQLKRQLTEYSYRSSEELPSRTILATLESSIIEIHRLQKELDSVNKEMAILKSKETETKKDGE